MRLLPLLVMFMHRKGVRLRRRLSVAVVLNARIRERMGR